MDQTVMCRSCNERPAQGGPLCARCTDLKMGLAVPTDEEAERLGLLKPDVEASPDQPAPLRGFSVDPVEPAWPSHVQVARNARRAGQRFLQMTLPLSDTRRTAAGVMGGSKAMVTDFYTEIPEVLQGIEDEGWRLEHASYVFQETGSVSRDKFFSSGQVEAVTGTIIGIYLFRAIDSERLE